MQALKIAFVAFLINSLFIQAGYAVTAGTPALIWSKQVDVSDPAKWIQAQGVATDNKGNSFVVGFTQGALPGQTQQGIWDYFIAKHDQKGNVIWEKQIGNTDQKIGPGATQAMAVAIDNVGNIYVAGQSNIGISGQPDGGSFFIAKYTDLGNDGKLDWTKTDGYDKAPAHIYGMSLDMQGNIYVTGEAQYLTGSSQYFIAKYTDENTGATLRWAKSVGPTDGHVGWLPAGAGALGISADGKGSVYIAGLTNCDISGQKVTGQSDYLIAKYTDQGDDAVLRWTKLVGGPDGFTNANGITTDQNGNIYITGSTNVGISGQAHVGDDFDGDYFVAKYTDQGDDAVLDWTKLAQALLGHDILAGGLGIVVDQSGNSYITGEDLGGFLAECNNAGELLWSTNVGATSGLGIAVTPDDGIYIAGYISADKLKRSPIGKIALLNRNRLGQFKTQKSNQITSISYYVAHYQ